MKILNSKQVANLEIENARILAVDDEERQLLSVQNLLLSKGLQVETALGGINGIKTLEQNNHSVLAWDRPKKLKRQFDPL